MKFKTCPYCGCALDFGEKCDCRDNETVEEKKNYEKPVIRPDTKKQFIARKAG